MNDNKGFKTRTAGHEPVKIGIYSANDVIEIRFGASIPTEMTYPIEEWYEVYSEAYEKNWKIVKGHLESKGLSAEEIKAEDGRFRKQVLDIRNETSDEFNDEIAALNPYLVKLCEAFEKAAKTKLLEGVQLRHESEDSFRKKVEEMAKKTVATA